MTDATREAASQPQVLERLLVIRQRAGDVDGMAALYEDGAVLVDTEGRLWRGKDAIRACFTELVASGREFEFGTQSPAVVCGELALTSTRFADGDVTAEVARRQDDGTWLWAVDRFSLVRR
jgi:ketosteroid isomerase-like protein